MSTVTAEVAAGNLGFKTSTMADFYILAISRKNFYDAMFLNNHIIWTPC